MVGNFLRGFGTGVLAQDLANTNYEKDQAAKYAQMIQKAQLDTVKSVTVAKAREQAKAAAESDKYSKLLGPNGQPITDKGQILAAVGPMGYNQLAAGDFAQAQRDKLVTDKQRSIELSGSSPIAPPAPTMDMGNSPNLEQIDLTQDTPAPVMSGQPTQLPPLPEQNTGGDIPSLKQQKQQLISRKAQASAEGLGDAVKSIDTQIEGINLKLRDLGEPSEDELKAQRDADLQAIKDIDEKRTLTSQAREAAKRQLALLPSVGETGVLGKAKSVADKVLSAVGAGDVIKGDPSARELMTADKLPNFLSTVDLTKGSTSERENLRFDTNNYNDYNTVEGNKLILTTNYYTKTRADQEDQFKRSWFDKKNSLKGADAAWEAFKDDHPLISPKKLSKIQNANDVKRLSNALNVDNIETEDWKKYIDLTPQEITAAKKLGLKASVFIDARSNPELKSELEAALKGK